jgi:hypothetical protein
MTLYAATWSSLAVVASALVLASLVLRERRPA